jgi:DNA topoisomerase-3
VSLKIGTDATHAEHIETIKERQYVRINQQNLFEPNPLGLGLCEGNFVIIFNKK